MFGLWHEFVESFAFTVYKQRATFENEINQSDVIVSRESTIVSSINISRQRLFIKKNNLHGTKLFEVEKKKLRRQGNNESRRFRQILYMQQKRRLSLIRKISE